MKKLFMFLCIVFLFVSMAGSASAIPVYYEDTGHYYEWISGSYTWSAARSAASERSYLEEQGYLATITSAGENTFLLSLNSNGWLGGSDSGSEGTWLWMDGPEANDAFWIGGSGGTSPTYANWGGGEPNDLNGEDYIEYSSGTWNDLPGNTYSIGYFVEYNSPVPEPATMFLLGAGLIGLAGVRRKFKK